MPRRTKKDEDPEDLQTFLNNFHKEIEGNSDEKVVNTILEAISAEAIDLDENGAEAGGSKPMEEAEADLDHAEEAEEEEEDDEDKYFIDDEGNCYIKTTPKKQKELQRSSNRRLPSRGKLHVPWSVQPPINVSYPLPYMCVHLYHLLDSF